MSVAKITYLTERILKLKRERNALILAHNYQLGEIQDIADFIGDSLDLSQVAAGSSASVIVFCGVRFMAETAAILCPDRVVLLPDIKAGCSLADMITAEHVNHKKMEIPKAAVVCYVNSPAEVKAVSDICCTSANAVQVVESLNNDEIIFIPDQHLGHYVSTKTDKHIILWPGYCPTHTRITAHDILRLKSKYPRAKVVMHPECPPEVVDLADEVLGTGGMIRYARREDVNELIVGTEIGIIHRLRKENPNKRFIGVSDQAICPDMKLITLGKVLQSLEAMEPHVKVADTICHKARVAIDRMLAIPLASRTDCDLCVNRKQ